MDASTNHESEDRMSASSQLEAAVIKMISVSYTHKEINNLVRKTILDLGAKLPSRRVLHNRAYGAFSFSDSFNEKLSGAVDYVDPEREDPLIIQAIIDFGREICTRFPFILEDYNVSEKWKLQHLMAAKSKGALDQVDPDLAARLASFNRPSPPSDEDLEFVDYAEKHPESWMCHRKLYLPNAPGFFCQQVTAVQFAHQLLHDAPEIYRDQGPSNKDIDTQIYECVGLAGASGEHSTICLGTVPAMVDYTIDEYDGYESLKF